MRLAVVSFTPAIDLSAEFRSLRVNSTQAFSKLISESGDCVLLSILYSSKD